MPALMQKEPVSLRKTGPKLGLGPSGDHALIIKPDHSMGPISYFRHADAMHD